MAKNQTEQEEREYLRQIIGRILETIGATDTSVKEHVDTLQEYKEYLWSNRDIDPQEIRSMRESILNHFARGENVIGKRQRLGRMVENPYFGRIDFTEKGTTGEVPVYIGIHTYYDAASKTNLVYDWRAPVSGLFYDHESGGASYLSPAGEVRGDVSLKRQYRIRGGRMEYMIESALTVHDEVLQRELSAHADDKMKNIVATIQREQNRIIRNDEAHTLIIQGVAGSGKTSIALHRIAYLLYAGRGDLSSSDVLILSPNRVFADYISNVLPELGEETVPETSLEQLLSSVLGRHYAFQDFFGQVAELSEHPDEAFVERIRYKASFEFVAQLDRFILHVENTFFRPADVRLPKGVTVPAELIGEQYRRFGRYPVRRRFEPMCDYIFEELFVRYRMTLTTAERNRFRKEVMKMFSGHQDLALYRAFFDWAGAPQMFRLRKNRTLEYADLAPLAYLHLAMEGSGEPSRVKHLLIDEMQDYSPVQYKVIAKRYPCRKTILGDAGQSVNPYGSSTAGMIRQALVSGEVMKLCKSYRSTFEITAFAQRIRRDADLEPVARHGGQPQVREYGNAAGERSGIADLIARFRQSGYESLGIVCKTEEQARTLAGELNARGCGVAFLSSRSAAFARGAIVTSAHMAKGLEFDEVIVPGVDDRNYASETDRSLLYVGVTRAMHKLTLTCVGQKSRFVV